MARTTNPVHKLPSGRWQARYRDDEGVQRKQTFDTARDASAFLDQVRTEVRRGAYISPDAGRQTFRSFTDEWAAGQDWKASTRETFESHRRRFGRHLDKLRLDQIDELKLRNVRTALTAAYATSTSTITMHYACAVMRSAFRAGRIPRDPTVALKPPRRRGGDVDGVVGPEQVPTRDEVVAIMAASPDRFRAAVALGACGMRIGEVMGASVSRFDLETGTLLIDRQLQRVGGSNVLTAPKREKIRTIKLPGWARLEVRRHLRDHGPFLAFDGDADADLLFRGGRDAVLRRDAFYDSCWKPALDAAGLAGRFKFHSLRHWCASSLLAEGASLTAVAGHLGDTVQTVSSTYAHWLRDDRDVPAAVLDRLLVAPLQIAR